MHVPQGLTGGLSGQDDTNCCRLRAWCRDARAGHHAVHKLCSRTCAHPNVDIVIGPLMFHRSHASGLAQWA